MSFPNSAVKSHRGHNPPVKEAKKEWLARMKKARSAMSEELKTLSKKARVTVQAKH